MAHPTPSPLSALRAQALLVLAGCLLAGPALAAVLYPNLPNGAKYLAKADWYQQCMRVRSLGAPAKDRPRDGDLSRCDAAELYYDTQHLEAADAGAWKKVRNCAFRTNNTAVLMMLYANGEGVYPNLNLATKYACSVDSTPDEMKARVAHLRRKAAGSGESFDLCDDISSASMQGQCAGLRERGHDQQRGGQLAALARTWSPKEQTGFDLAYKAAHNFGQHRAEYETDASGSAKRSLQLEASSSELDQFVRDIRDFESGKVPQFSEGEFRALEDSMNRTYQQFMAAPASDASYLGTIRKSGVEKTQHAWLAFRDAVELFGSMKYPAAPASGLRALLTSRRLKQLSELENAAEGR
ncbi:MAG: lysozyme inhibitor LprI family protein [Massilia sp.]